MLIADRILEYLYSKENAPHGSKDVANELGVTEYEVITAVEGVFKIKKGFISEGKFKHSFGDSSKALYAMHGMEKVVLEFISSGGFKKIYSQLEEERKREAQQKDTTAVLTQLQIDQLLKLPKEALWTRGLAIVAIVVSIIALLKK